jgi:8-oxo-dGTP pyrophosphatase MutT (NUDIX family)
MKKPIFSEKIEWKGRFYEVSIFDSQEFDKLENIQQVYGFVFNEEGNILLIKLPEGNWCLPGGGPESFDENWKETLKREVLEEADVEIINIKPVCYLISKCEKEDKNNAKQGIMLRAIAEVKEIKEQTSDPAHGKINERTFVSPKEFLKYCNWSENGKVQLKLALKKLKDRDQN